MELSWVNFTNVAIFNNKNFELLTAATLLLQHIIFFYHYLKKLHGSFCQCYQSYYFFKMALSNFYAKVFLTLETLVFFSRLVSHNIKVCLDCNFFKPFLVYIVKIMEMTIKIHGNCRSACQVSYVAVRQWLEILVNGFFINNFGKYWHNVSRTSSPKCFSSFASE